MIKIEKLYNFGLLTGTVFVATEEEAKEICKELGTEIWGQGEADYSDVEDYICCGGEISENVFLEVQNGYIYIDPEECEIDFYSKKDVCEQMLPTIAETYV